MRQLVRLRGIEWYVLERRVASTGRVYDDTESVARGRPPPHVGDVRWTLRCPRPTLESFGSLKRRLHSCAPTVARAGRLLSQQERVEEREGVNSTAGLHQTRSHCQIR